MNQVLNILKIHYPNIEFKVASLFYKDTAIIKPDYSVNKTDTWIEFFWEVDLDIKDNN